MEKLLSGTRDQGDRGDSVSPEETSFPRSDTLSECFNNVDVGVPLWLIELRDKHLHQEFASPTPLFKFLHFILAILVCLYFRRVES